MPVRQVGLSLFVDYTVDDATADNVGDCYLQLAEIEPVIAP